MKFKLKHNLLILTIVIMLFNIMSNTVAYAYPATGSLSGLPVTVQSKTNWCWAACTSSVLIYKSHNISQKTVYSYIKGSSDTNIAGTMNEMRTALSHWGVNSNIVGGKVSFNSVASNISTSKRPMIVGIKNANLPVGHVMVICGYDVGVSNYVQLMDPAQNSKKYVLYSELVNDTSTGYKWKDTLNKIY